MINKNVFYNVIFISFLFAFVNATEANIISQSNWSGAVVKNLPSNNGPVQAIVRNLSFSWRRSTNQKIESRNVEAVIIPNQNLYWLGYSSLGIGTERQFFVFANSIVGVAAFPGDVIQFYSSSNLLKTNNAEGEIDSIFNDKINQFDKADFDISPKQLGMENILGNFPFTGTPTAQGEPAPVITKIDVDNSSFTVHFAGGPSNNVTASITFNQNFKPTQATLNGVQVFPANTK